MYMYNDMCVDILASKLVSDFLNAMRNTHHILPASKLQFILDVLDSSVNLLYQPSMSLSVTVAVHCTHSYS